MWGVALLHGIGFWFGMYAIFMLRFFAVLQNVFIISLLDLVLCFFALFLFVVFLRFDSAALTCFLLSLCCCLWCFGFPGAMHGFCFVYCVFLLFFKRDLTDCCCFCC